MASPAPPAGLVARLRAAGCVFAEEEAGPARREADGRRPPRAPGGRAGRRRPARAGRRLGGVLRAADRRRADACSCRAAAPSCSSRVALESLRARRRRGRPRLRDRRDRGRAARRRARVWTCTPPTSTRRPSPARAATCRRTGCTRATCTTRCRRACAAAWRWSPRTRRTCRPRRSRTMPPEARDHEARVALDGGPDGLDVQRRVIAEAPGWLAPGGRLLVETEPAAGRRGPAPRWRPPGCRRGAPRPRSGRHGRGGSPAAELHQRWYSNRAAAPLDFAHRGQPRYGDGLHPHVRRSPGGGWLRSGAVAPARSRRFYGSRSQEVRDRPVDHLGPLELEEVAGVGDDDDLGAVPAGGRRPSRRTRRRGSRRPHRAGRGVAGPASRRGSPARCGRPRAPSTAW